jgi:CDP-diacylglycerol--glycerol-3-phosphate 3-phosphatidyltransferase
MNLIPQVVRVGFVRMLGPLVQALVRLRVHPNVITTLGTLVLLGSAAAFGSGQVQWGGFLLLVSGVFDLLDGRVAREGGRVTAFGAFYDSTLDRVGEAALFMGIGIFFLRDGVAPSRMGLGVGLCFVALTASLLVSYARARAEGLGIECKVGIAQRAERVLLLGAPTMVFGAGNQGALLFWIVAVLALATTVTVVQRVVHVARAVGARPAPRPRSWDTLPGHSPALHSVKDSDRAKAGR